MYEKASKYRYSVGFLGYLLVFLCFAYVVIWICYYCSVFLDVAFKSKKDDFLNTLLIWSALKPGLALFVAVYVVLSLYDPVTLLILVISCGVIWAGTLAMNIKFLVDRFATCNSASDPHNLCNDLLYCCVHFDTVASCAGLGPCSNVTSFSGTGNLTASNLHVNEDFARLGIFSGLFVVLVPWLNH